MLNENQNISELNQEPSLEQDPREIAPEKISSGTSGIKFFGCCSKSLKRFSVIIFIINVFLSIGIMGALVISLFFKVGLDMLKFLIFPLIAVFIVLIIISRFISALIYGFAEIVEKNEKN